MIGGQMKKLGFQNACLSSLYNKHENFDKIEPTFLHVNEDGSKNYKMVDHSQIGVIPGGLAETTNFSSGDPTNPLVAWRNPHEREVIE